MFIGIIGSTVCQLTQMLVVSGMYDDIGLIAIDMVGESFFSMLIFMPLIVIIAHNAEDGLISIKIP